MNVLSKVAICVSLPLALIAFAAMSVKGQGNQETRVGFITSVEQFVALEEKLKDTVPLYNNLLLAYCVCAKDPSKIVFAHTMVGGELEKVIADCRRAAQPCGGCLKTPAYKILGPSDWRMQAEEEQLRRDELMRTAPYFSDEDGLRTGRSGERGRSQKSRGD